MALSLTDFHARLHFPPSRLSHLSFNHVYHQPHYDSHCAIGYEAFLSRIATCTRCPIALERHWPPVLPKGDLASPVVWVGRNPGRTEGKEGEPFHPKAPGGNLLDKYLVWAGLSREQCYITNTLFCYTQGDRAPTGTECVKCSIYKPFEFANLECPKFIFLLGNDALHAFDPNAPSITKIYGASYFVSGNEYLNGACYLFPVYHPGSLLRDGKLYSVVTDQLKYIKDVFLDPYWQFLARNPSLEERRLWQTPRHLAYENHN